jgi:DNA-binding IscR family transcriptional regulator
MFIRQNECCLCLLRSPSAISYKMIINGTERNGKMNTCVNKKQFSPMFIRQNECCLCLLRSPSAICYKMINETEWKRNGTERQNECCLCLLSSPSAISYKMIINGTERNGKMNTCDNKKQFSPMFIRQNECCLCLLRSPSAICYKMINGTEWNGMKTERNGKMNAVFVCLGLLQLFHTKWS